MSGADSMDAASHLRPFNDRSCRTTYSEVFELLESVEIEEPDRSLQSVKKLCCSRTMDFKLSNLYKNLEMVVLLGNMTFRYTVIEPQSRL